MIGDTSHYFYGIRVFRNGVQVDSGIGCMPNGNNAYSVQKSQIFHSIEEMVEDMPHNRDFFSVKAYEHRAIHFDDDYAVSCIFPPSDKQCEEIAMLLSERRRPR